MRNTLVDNEIDAILILSKENFQYLLGFTTESPSYLVVPSNKYESEPMIFTNSLEAEICKFKNTLKNITITVENIDVDPKIQNQLNQTDFHHIQYQGKNLIVPNESLKLAYQNETQRQIAEKLQPLTFDFNLPNVPISDIIDNQMQNHTLIKTQWHEKEVLVPRKNNYRIISEYIALNAFLTMGIEYNALNYQQYLNFSQTIKTNYTNGNFSKFKFIDCSTYLHRQRAQKDPDEIEKMKKAAQIADLGFQAGLSFIHEFETENRVQAEIEYTMKKAGSSIPAFETIVVSGYKSAFPHGHAGEKQIEKGDLVIVDLGATFEGYRSDMTRTVIAGYETGEQAPPNVKKILNLVRNAHKIGLNAVGLGIPWGESDLQVRQFFNKENVLQYYNHSLGHGVGVEAHEQPWVSYRMINSTHILQENMVLTIEPGLYYPDLGGARTEDTIVVKEEGIELLTRSPYAEYI